MDAMTADIAKELLGGEGHHINGTSASTLVNAVTFATQSPTIIGPNIISVSSPQTGLNGLRVTQTGQDEGAMLFSPETNTNPQSGSAQTNSRSSAANRASVDFAGSSTLFASTEAGEGTHDAGNARSSNSSDTLERMATFDWHSPISQRSHSPFTATGSRTPPSKRRRSGVPSQPHTALTAEPQEPSRGSGGRWMESGYVEAFVQLELQRLAAERQRMDLEQQRWREERAERQRWEQMFAERWREEREERRTAREREQNIWRILLGMRACDSASGNIL
ncbi:hypothetical protein H4R24_003839 [Coemansia sp. RSA 988]|nr:hypothetical protein H4R24_003839 [Coemansia sp. RSA 988]